MIVSDRRKSLTVPGANNFASPSGGGVGGTKSANSSPVGDSIPIPGGGGGSGGLVKLGSGGDKTGSPRHRTSNDAWVCPNDRQLALRAKLVLHTADYSHSFLPQKRIFLF